MEEEHGGGAGIGGRWINGGKSQRMGGGQEKDQGVGERSFSQGKGVGGETDEELSLDPASPTISVMSEAVKQFSDIDWVGPKNGFYKCPTTNASDVGEGLPRVKNQPSDDTLRPSLSDSGPRFTVNRHCPTSENLN